jgi:hypothetical protein
MLVLIPQKTYKLLEGLGYPWQVIGKVPWSNTGSANVGTYLIYKYISTRVITTKTNILKLSIKFVIIAQPI